MAWRGFRLSLSTSDSLGLTPLGLSPSFLSTQPAVARTRLDASKELAGVGTGRGPAGASSSLWPGRLPAWAVCGPRPVSPCTSAEPRMHRVLFPVPQAPSSLNCPYKPGLWIVSLHLHFMRARPSHGKMTHLRWRGTEPGFEPSNPMPRPLLITTMPSRGKDLVQGARAGLCGPTTSTPLLQRRGVAQRQM